MNASRKNQLSQASRTVYTKEAKTVRIDGQESIRSVAFLVDGMHVVTGGVEGKVRCFRAKDGREVGTPLDVRATVSSIAVSRDGKWVVCGTNCGQVTVWNTNSREEAMEFTAHSEWVRAMDVSPDVTKIVTGSYDRSVRVWSFPTSDESPRGLFGPMEHDWSLAAVKFSPDGHLIATATWCRSSIRVYDSQDAHLLVEFSVQVTSSENHSLAWASDSNRLFALSRDGNINCLDVHNGTTLSQWPIHSSTDSRCIALACDGRLIAASAGSSVSFWDTTTHKQIGTIIEHTSLIASMAISAKYDIVTGGGKEITLRNLCDMLPSSYYEDIFPKRPGATQKLKMLISGGPANHLVYRMTAQMKILNLEKTVQGLCHESATSQRTVDQKENFLDKSSY